MVDENPFEFIKFSSSIISEIHLNFSLESQFVSRSAVDGLPFRDYHLEFVL